jgi:phosphate transport system protein
MPVYLEREIERLKKQILSLSAYVEESLRDALESILKRNTALAAAVIAKDPMIDQMEVDLEEECLKILALHQPVAGDLRYVIAVMKINNDLERIGDLAANIAEQAAILAEMPGIEIPESLPDMAEQARLMVRKSLDALVNHDPAMAREVCGADESVDTLHRGMYAWVRETILKNPDQTDAILHILSVSRYLERIADHATNIAEDVIYTIRGEIVRHSNERFL